MTSEQKPAQPSEQPRSKSKGPAVKAPQAWHPVAWDEHQALAIQAVMDGNASSEQQKTAMRWIIEDACGTYDLSFRPGPGGDRDTVLAEGRRFVGLQIVKLSRINTSLFRKR